MKKIGIITINDLNNYGNRLQCYALQEYLSKLGTLPENIYNYNPILKKIIKDKILNIYSFFLKNRNFNIERARIKTFKSYDKYIKYSNFRILNNKYPKNISAAYDYFIVGSDQVWNTRFLTKVSETDFLRFAESNKRISYAASFGTSTISENFKEEYFYDLEKFKAISVREDAGRELIINNTNRKDVEVLIDPTMLLNAEHWVKVSKRPEMLNEKRFILCYFLGEISQKRKKEIERIAEEKKCEIINLLDKSSKYYATGPSEFLYLEKNAELICTDSFHSCVFAMIFNRPFIIFDREDFHANMNSRLETLLSKFNLKDRKFNGEIITEENLNHDYSEAYRILELEREKSENFLKKALDIEEKNNEN